MTWIDQLLTLQAQAKATLTFAADLQIWGASLWGDSDPGALTAEDEPYWHRGPLWDLIGPSPWVRVTDVGHEPVPLWWSLLWVGRLVVLPEGNA